MYIAEVRCTRLVESKINAKHHVTLAEVREAVQLTELVHAGMDFDAERGWRLLAVGRTYSGRVLKVVLYEADEKDGSWWVGTAMPG